jgi:hypothetical protein
MESLLIGVISSLAATAMWAFLASRFIGKIRFTLGRLLNTGISYVYANQAEARHDIEASAKQSRLTRILVVRGNSFHHDQGSLRSLVYDVREWQQLQFLMSDPEPNDDTNFVKIRAQETTEIDGQNAELLMEDVMLGVRRMATLVSDDKATLVSDNKRIQVKLHNFPAVYRIIIFDHELFLSFYSNAKRGGDNRVYRCPASTDLYYSFLRYFETIWDNSRILPPSGRLGTSVLPYPGATTTVHAEAAMTVEADTTTETRRNDHS